ncbi:MAG: pitrilysin family protein [Vulcanimicrobiaceae bacterium]
MLPRSLAVFRRAVSFVVLATLVLHTPPAPLVAAPSAASPSAPHVFMLANGLRVAIVEDHAAPVVQTAVWYRFGASDERPGKTGLAHALAHMMYRGTPSLSGSGLDDVFTRLGAQETATTANDFTAFRFVVPANALELALRVEADRMQHLLLDEPAWRNERAALLAERDAILDQPLTRLYDRVCKLATRARVCALAALGERGDIATATSGDIRAYYQEFYAPNDATLVIAGDVRSDDALGLANAIFGNIPRSEQSQRSVTAPLYAADLTTEIVGDFPYEVVDLAYAAPGSADTDAAAFAIVDAIVKNPRSDFNKALVRSGYSLGYSTQLDQNAHAGLYHVFLIVAPGHTSAQVRAAFTGVLATAQNGGFPADLVTAAKTNAARADVFAHDSLNELGDRAGYALAVEGIVDPARDTARVLAATGGDLQLVGRRYLRSPAVTGLLTPNVARTGVALAPPATSINDDFSRRAPRGPVVEARWVRRVVPPASARIAPRTVPVAFRLANGMRVLVSEIHANPTVYLHGSVETSPGFDPPAKTGIGALVAALLAYGSTRYDFDAQRKIADDTGASLDLGTTFSARGRAPDLDALLDVVAESLQHPSFPADAVERVRKQTLAAVAQRDGDPQYRATRDFDRLLVRRDDATLREPSRATILNVNRADLHAYAQRYIRPDLTTLSIAGDVDAAALRAKIEARFATWRATGSRPNPRLKPYPVTAPARRYIVSDRRLVDARLGEATIARDAADYDALAVISEVLGGDGAYDTRLMQQLHLERPVVASIATVLEADRYRGSLAIRFEVPPRNVRTAVAGVRREFERLQRDPVGPFELDRARSKIVARTLLGEQSTQTIAARVERLAADGLRPDSDATLGARFAALNGAQIMHAAQRYLHPDALIEIYEGPRP